MDISIPTSQDTLVSHINTTAITVDKIASRTISMDTSNISSNPSASITEHSNSFHSETLQPPGFSLVNLDLEQLQLEQVQQEQQQADNMIDEIDDDCDGVSLVVKSTYWWCKDCNVKQKFGCGESMEDHLHLKHRIKNKVEDVMDLQFTESSVIEDCNQGQPQEPPASDMFASVYTIPSNSMTVQDQAVDTLIVFDDSTTLQVITKPSEDTCLFPSPPTPSASASKPAAVSQNMTKAPADCAMSSTNSLAKVADIDGLPQLKPIPVIPALPPTLYSQSVSGCASSKIHDKESAETKAHVKYPVSKADSCNNQNASNPALSTEHKKSETIESDKTNQPPCESQPIKDITASSLPLPRKSGMLNVGTNLVTKRQTRQATAKNAKGIQLQDCRILVKRLSISEIKQIKNKEKPSVKPHTKRLPFTRSREVKIKSSMKLYRERLSLTKSRIVAENSSVEPNSQRLSSSKSKSVKQIRGRKTLSTLQSKVVKNSAETDQSSNLQQLSRKPRHSRSKDVKSVDASREHVFSRLKARSSSGRQIKKPLRYITGSESEEEEVENDVCHSEPDKKSARLRSCLGEVSPKKQKQCATGVSPTKQRQCAKKRKITSVCHDESEKQTETEKVENSALFSPSKKAREEKYSCQDCGRKFRFEAKWKKHVELYKGQAMQQCSVCSVKLHNLDLLNVHIYHVHKTQESTSCISCGKVLGSKRNLLSHLLTHSNAKGQSIANLIKDSCAVHQCHICDDTIIIGEGRVEKHYLLHEKPNIYTCQKCEQTFQHKGDLYCHLKTHGDLNEADEQNRDRNQTTARNINDKEQTSHSSNHLSVNQHHSEKMDLPGVDMQSDQKLIAESVERIMKFEENTDNQITVSFIPHTLKEMETDVQITHTNSSFFYCELCSEQFATKKLLYQHLKSHGKSRSASSNIPEQEPASQPIDLSAGVPFGISCSVVNLEGLKLKEGESFLRRSFKTTPDGLVVSCQMHYSCALCEREFKSENLAKRHVNRFKEQQTIVQCSLCQCKFHNLDLFNVHYTYVHQPEGAASCVTCNMEFSNKGDFLTHLGNTPTAHPLSFKSGLKTFLQDTCGTVTCPTCQKSMWNYPMNIANHTKMHKSFNCPICLQGFPYKYALLVHQQIHSNSSKVSMLNKRDLEQDETAKQIEKIHRTVMEMESSEFVENEAIAKFCCPLCDAEVTHLRKNIHKHLDLHARKLLYKIRENLYFCPDCGEDIVVTEKNILEHMSSHGYQAVQYVCVFCAQSFASFKEFKEHEVKKHWLNSYFEKSMCEVCGKELVNRQELREHVKLHEEKQGLFACPHCKQTFRFESKLQKHMAKHDSGRDSYACQFCGKLYMTKISLDRHEQVDHRGIKDFKHKCKQCDAQFINATHLRDHVTNKHTTKASYTCPECGMGFKHLSTYVRHKRVVHGGDTPYVCQHCGEKFPERKELRRHMIIHTGIDPFKCPACHKSFSWERTMQEHYDFVHRGIVKFMCNRCGSKFPRKRNLLRHMTTCRTNTSGDT